MAAMILLMLLVIVVAGTAAVVTTLVFKSLQGRAPQQRPQLPPPGARPGPSAWQGYQGQPGPRYPAYDPAHYLSPGDRERIMIMLRGGRKMHAIKLYREVTGAGLAEAKAAVEHMERYR